jgi:hypothetical protein
MVHYIRVYTQTFQWDALLSSRTRGSPHGYPAIGFMLNRLKVFWSSVSFAGLIVRQVMAPDIGTSHPIILMKTKDLTEIMVLEFCCGICSSVTKGLGYQHQFVAPLCLKFYWRISRNDWMLQFINWSGMSHFFECLVPQCKIQSRDNSSTIGVLMNWASFGYIGSVYNAWRIHSAANIFLPPLACTSKITPVQGSVRAFLWILSPVPTAPWSQKNRTWCILILCHKACTGAALIVLLSQSPLQKDFLHILEQVGWIVIPRGHLEIFTLCLIRSSKKLGMDGSHHSCECDPS